MDDDEITYDDWPTTDAEVDACVVRAQEALARTPEARNAARDAERSASLQWQRAEIQSREWFGRWL